MTTNYDPIAEQYKISKLQPWRAHVEGFTLLKYVGNLSGLAGVDIACGEGFYTRMLRHRGAAKVTGVDLSREMINLARASEAEQQLGIDYRVGDARQLGLDSEYNVAVAAYLLNYAPNRAELAAMCNGIARCLKPGGRFVTVNCNPENYFPSAPSYRKYGFETTPIGEWREGTPITWHFFLEDGREFEIENYYLSIQTHEEVLRAAGFREVRWHRAELSPEGEKSYGKEFWADMISHPPLICIEALL